MIAMPRHASPLAILGRVFRYLIFASILTGLLADAVAGLFPTLTEQRLAAGGTVAVCAAIAGYIIRRRWEKKR